MAIEETFIIIKPEAVSQCLIGEILGRFEEKGLRITRLKVHTIEESVAQEHYAHHQGKPFFPELLEAMTCGPVVFGILEGENAVAEVRKIVGATNPAEAVPGTIRGDLATKLPYNMVHAADSPVNAQVEIQRFFD